MEITKKDDYFVRRNHIINKEKEMFLGGNTNLTDDEMKVNEKLIKIKFNELKSCYEDSNKFLPLQHFFSAKTEIENSKIFKIIQKLPKGHSLHSHLLASASVDFMIKNITYDPNAYGKYVGNNFKVKFMLPKQAEKDEWISLNVMRSRNEHFDKWLSTQFSLIVENPSEIYTSIETIWIKFKKIFNSIYDMLSYKPAFEKYYYQCLKELYEDNVMYCEFRATPMPLYDLEGNSYTSEDFFNLMLEVEKKFKEDHKEFFGAGYIHSVYRGISLEDLKKDLEEINDLRKKYPKLIVGLDFVGFEEEGHSLINFHEIIEKYVNDFKFFFHAGETNWFGHTDTNLIDAVLLKTKRIGHGFALNKHPVLLDMIKEFDICIEHCPISNKVLLLIEDPRNHPIINLMTKDLPVCVCNDDPSCWGAKGLSYDWYITFMAMTPERYGLNVLKKLAINSINYSALSDEDKKRAMDLWKQQWNKFVQEFLNEIN